MCSMCKAQKAALAARKASLPQESRSKKGIYHKPGERPKGKKQRLDVLAQASKDYFKALDSAEDGRAAAFNCKWKDQGHRSGPWRCWHGWPSRWLKDDLKKYMKALKACVDAGDVPPPSWYGTNR